MQPAATADTNTFGGREWCLGVDNRLALNKIMRRINCFCSWKMPFQILLCGYVFIISYLDILNSLARDISIRNEQPVIYFLLLQNCIN